VIEKWPDEVQLSAIENGIVADGAQIVHIGQHRLVTVTVIAQIVQIVHCSFLPPLRLPSMQVSGSTRVTR